MAVEIHPVKLDGEWDAGYALDKYVLHSTAIGPGPYGKMQYDNQYSDIADLLRRFKYYGEYDNLSEIVDTIALFLVAHNEMSDFDVVVPAPPSNTNRSYQPTIEIAKALSRKFGLVYTDGVLVKKSNVESKSLARDELYKLEGSIVKGKKAKRKMNALLVDDTYRTGHTLGQCCRLLRSDPLIGKIYVLTVTKNKNSY